VKLRIGSNYFGLLRIGLDFGAIEDEDENEGDQGGLGGFWPLGRKVP